MAIPNLSGRSLLAAIWQFAEPEAWAKFEQLLGLEVVTAEERASWNADDWARRDYQMALMLQNARLRPAEYVTALHSWAQLRNAFKARLQSGELVATGYVKPVELTDRPTAIPTDKWRFLKLDYLNGSASGEGLEIVSIVVSPSDQADQAPSGRQSAEAAAVRDDAFPNRRATTANEAPARPKVKRRKGGLKPGPYYSQLKKFMKFLHENNLEKFENGTPCELRSLVELRFKRDGVLRYPKRSGLDKAIAKAKQEVIDSADRL